MSTAYPLKRCLVTGASGFVGRVLCEKLKKEGLTVRALLRREQAGPWHETVISDLNHFEQSGEEIFSGINTVFYLSSIAHDKAPADMYDAFNVQLCLQFARMAIQHGVTRFIYISSTKAVADPGAVLVDETFQALPDDKYGLSKRRAEEGLLAAAGFEHLAIVRPCLIYGKGMRGNLYSILKWIDRGIFPPLPETSARRSMVSVRDVAAALILAAASPVAHRKIYFLTDGESYSVKEIEHAMRDVLHKKRPRWYIPEWFLLLLSRTGDVLQKILGRFPFNSKTLDKLLGPSRYSTEKIQKELGWKPTENFWQVLPEIADDLHARKLSP